MVSLNITHKYLNALWNLYEGSYINKFEAYSEVYFINVVIKISVYFLENKQCRQRATEQQELPIAEVLNVYLTK